jgi:hypothetical protein
MEVHAHSHPIAIGYQEKKKQDHFFRELILLFLMVFCSCFSANTQQSKLVVDNENLFTETEITSIDSLLRAYHKKSGNLVAVYTDTANISIPEHSASVYATFKKPSTDSAYSYILLMSRKHSLLYSNVNTKTVPFITDQLLVGILEAGFASLKEKRRAVGVILICKKAMEFLDRLPKK